MSGTFNAEDSSGGIFSPKRDEDDVHIIDRNLPESSNYDSTNNLIPLQIGTPKLQYDNDVNYLDQTQGENQNNENNNYPQNYEPSGFTPTGFTPVLAPNMGTDYQANQQISTLNQPKFYSSIPPLQPLSESVIPNGLSIHPFALKGKPTFESNEKRPPPQSKKKKESTQPKTRPAFVVKLWSMVNDPANHDYIRWNDDGKTFQVFHREDFMKVVLPKYFKHNNFASFVRQLNMYGWHKVQDITSGTMNNQKDERGNDEAWQFENPYFIRGQEDLLDKIVRNRNGGQEGESNESLVNFGLVMNELDQIKMNQMAIGEDLRRVRKDNQVLWAENNRTRETQKEQAQTLDKILHFLAAVYGNNAGKILEVDQAPFDGEHYMTSYNYPNQTFAQAPPPGHLSSVQFNPYTQRLPSPFNKPRLMLTNEAHQRSPSTKDDSRRNSTINPTSAPESIEEIMRSYGNTPNTPGANSPNVSKMYQQIMNQDGGASSPRPFFPDLVLGGSYHQNRPQSPHEANGSSTHDLINGIEQDVNKQGQSLQKVQDWIQDLASQQEKGQHRAQGTVEELSPKKDLDEFDVNEFLNSSQNYHAGATLQSQGVGLQDGAAQKLLKRARSDPVPQSVKRTRRLQPK